MIKKHRRENYIKPYKAHRGIFFIGMVCFIILFSANLVSAWDWDNVKSYDPITKEITIKNAFGLPLIGDDIAKIKLNTPINYYVGAGYGKVAEFTINSYTDYDNALKQLDLYDIRNDMEEITRDFDYKYLTYKDVEVENYYFDCYNQLAVNGSMERICNKIITGSHIERREVWNDFGKDIIEGEITIGIFTNVEAKEKVEWIPTFFGERIDEWAVWTASLNVGLVSFYKLNGTTGVVLDSLNINNGTNNGATRGVEGIINNSFDFEESESDFVNLGNDTSLNPEEISISLWVNVESRSGEDFAITRWLGGEQSYGVGTNSTNNKFASLFATAAGTNRPDSNTTFVTSQWYHIVTTWDSTTGGKIYVNGTETGSNNDNPGTLKSISEDTVIGGFTNIPSLEWDGKIDEVGFWNRTLSASEVTQLYNNGAAITWTDSFAAVVTIVFPQNITYNETLTELNYTVTNGDRCWFSTDAGVTNSSDVPSGTNFTGLTSQSLVNEWIVYCNNTEGEGLDTVVFFVNKSVQTELILPANDSMFATPLINFSVNSTPINTNLTNVTLFIWNANGTVFLTNTTILSGSSEVQTNFPSILTDGVFLWNAETCGEDIDCSFATNNRTFEIESTFPLITIESPIGILDYNFISGNETLNVTFVDINLDTCWFDYNGTNITIDGCLTGVKNSTLFILEENNLNMTVYANDSFGNENSTFTSWDYKVFENSRTFSSNTFETKSEIFIINVSANSSLTAVSLIYDGTSRATTLTNNISTITFDIPISSGSKTFNWSFTYGAETITSSISTQTVNEIVWNFCNSTLSVAYMNFTFKNETLGQEDLNATIDSSWNIWLGTGAVSKSFTISNATENSGYGFCFSASNDTLFTNVTLVYNNVDSQQRVFISEPVLTNSTTLQTLFLLPSQLGLFGQFQTRDIANNPIALVKGVISRTLGGSVVNVVSGFTDSSGIVIFFLNPDVLYTALFSKSGFVDNTFAFVPTTDLRFVTMGTGVSVEGSNISIETNYVITPLSSTLTNGTSTTFGFNVTGNDEITFISMNITDGNVTGFGFNSSNGLGFISLIINTSDNKTLVGIFEIRTDSENLTISKVWIIGNEFEGDYSISKQGKLFLQYEFSDFIRLIMVIFIIFGVVIFMSSNELADNNESKIAVIVLMIWGFSFIGWLDNPAAVSTTGIAQYAKQYGIAILSTAGALFFFIRRIFV